MTAPLSDYGAWLAAQTKERQEASLANMQRCIRLGELDRSEPRCDEARRLRYEIAAHYEGMKGGSA